MRKIMFLSLCLCLALTSSAVYAQSLAVHQDSIGGAAVQDGFPNVFRPVGRIVKRFFGVKSKPFSCGLGAKVTNLE